MLFGWVCQGVKALIWPAVLVYKVMEYLKMSMVKFLGLVCYPAIISPIFISSKKGCSVETTFSILLLVTSCIIFSAT